MSIMQDVCKKCAEKKVPCTLYLSNGFQMRGTITGHDDSGIKLKDNDGKYHAVSMRVLSTIDAPEEVFK